MEKDNTVQPANKLGREALIAWQQEIQKNCYLVNSDFRHSIKLYLNDLFAKLDPQLAKFGEAISKELEPLVVENNLACNLPRLENYDGIGQQTNAVVHHPSYQKAGDIIYASRLLERMSKPGGLLECLSFFFLSCHAGEAGHNCPIACSASIVRVLQKTADFTEKQNYLKRLIAPSYRDNFTGAQFLTEIQGGSDVGKNATIAYRDKQGKWYIKGEKWFCSNANADLILLTARYDPSTTGTKGLGLFLVPAKLDSGQNNSYRFRRLKDKLGTRSMASAEIDFQGAYAIVIGPPETGFKMVMENVLHLSRLFNTISVLGMGQRAYQIAKTYTKYREAFGQPVFNYPLVKQNLARIKAENTAMLASIFATVKLQDAFDKGEISGTENQLLLRLLANLNKFLSALWTVDHIHHSIDMLAGNGAIENFSTLPRLFRDSIVCENWEGTHNTLRMQILRDIHKYQIDTIYINYIKQQLKPINKPEKQRKQIEAKLTQLESKLNRLKTIPMDLQSLIVKTIVNDMAVIFCATHLLKESIHQTSTLKSTSKYHCLNYFLLQHLNEKSAQYDKNYLELITAVTQS